MRPGNDVVKEWALKVADEWKEKTRIDVQRPQFKVLDQTIARQLNHAEQNRTAAKIHPSDDGKVNCEVYDDKEFYIQGLKDIVARGNSDSYSELKQMASEQTNRKKAKKDRDR